MRPENSLEMLDRAKALPLLAAGLHGIERETLRVSPQGCLAQTPHPQALGAALTHPYITTDYSEALLEFVTPALPGVTETVAFLTDLHAFTYRHISAELLWPASMPCVLGDDDSIPIARYGSSNSGMMKHIYRRGLGHRYGRKMQTIAGVHFNYSLAEPLWPVLREAEKSSTEPTAYRSQRYFDLLRNFQRHGWLIPFLFGASPAICRSFLGGRQHDFQELDRCTWYAPHATSLRMSDIGYKNKAQAGLKISYANLNDYLDGLQTALRTEDPEYAAIGTQVNGEWRQLSTSILQIENEFYSFIRPKHPAQRGERPTAALQRGGVQYVEVRALDCDPYAPAGVTEESLRFIEALLLYCLFTASPPLTPDEQRAIEHNQLLVARQGRAPDLQLALNGKERPLREWAMDILDALNDICLALDGGQQHGPYQQALAAQRAKLEDFALLPSARVVADLRTNGSSLLHEALRLAYAHRQTLQAHALPETRAAEFTRLAASSLIEQQELEHSDTLDFADYLQRYYAAG